jgi:hypothetical protein
MVVLREKKEVAICRYLVTQGWGVVDDARLESYYPSLLAREWEIR